MHGNSSADCTGTNARLEPSERPVAFVVLGPSVALTQDALIEWLTPQVAKWWLPDEVIFIDEVPKTSVGKFSKKTLREQFADHVLTGG